MGGLAFGRRWCKLLIALIGSQSVINSGAFAPDECIFPVDTLGVYNAQSCQRGGFAMNFGTNGLGYSAGTGGLGAEGIVFDPTTWTMVQTWPLPNRNPSSLLPDVGLNKLFGYATSSAMLSGCWIQSFSLDSLMAISSAPLPRLFTGSPSPNGECNYASSPIVRWGATGSPS